MKIDKTLIWGDGGHAKMIYSLINDKKKFGKIYMISKNEENNFLKMASEKNSYSILGIGDISSRNNLLVTLNKKNVKWLTILSESAIIAKNVFLGAGTVIMPGSVINNNVKILNHVIINTGSLIDHDCKIGNNSSIGPGGVLTGGCIIGDNVEINSNVTISPNICISDNIKVGACSFVNKNLNLNGLYYGQPARFIKQN